MEISHSSGYLPLLQLRSYQPLTWSTILILNSSPIFDDSLSSQRASRTSFPSTRSMLNRKASTPRSPIPEGDTPELRPLYTLSRRRVSSQHYAPNLVQFSGYCGSLIRSCSAVCSVQQLAVPEAEQGLPTTPRPKGMAYYWECTRHSP